MQVDYIEITAWNQLAETVEKYLKKGSKINVTGRLKQTKYQNSNGDTISKLYVLAELIDYLANTKIDKNEDEVLFNKIY